MTFNIYIYINLALIYLVDSVKDKETKIEFKRVCQKNYLKHSQLSTILHLRLETVNKMVLTHLVELR